jgi:hypothetical protein
MGLFVAEGKSTVFISVRIETHPTSEIYITIIADNAQHGIDVSV